MLRARLVTAAVASASLATAGIAVAGATSNLSAVVRPVTGAYLSGRVLVHYRADARASQRDSLERRNNASSIRHLTPLGTEVLRVPAGHEQGVVRALAASGLVDYAEVDGLATASDIIPNDPDWSKEWGQSKIHMPHAWGVTQGSSSITVAVVDSGLTAGLPEFAGRVLTGYNAFTRTTDATDDNSHGTYVTGVALAQGNNSAGVAGMCWSCRVLPVKVLDSSGQGDYATIANGITWAADHGARVINLSLGGTTASSTLDSAVSYAVGKGIVVVVAAGNSASTSPTYPADSPGALSVGATDSTDTLYSYSNRGSWVDVAAPGSNYSTGGDGNFYPFGGTSSAAPVVSGLAALMLSFNSTATVDAITHAIESTTAVVSGGGVAYGRVDAGAAMDYLSGGTTTSPSPSPSASPTTSPSPSPSPSPSSSPTASASPSPTSSSTKHGGGGKH